MNGEFNNMNCMLALPKYKDNHFDLAICDPPYGIGEDGRKTWGRTLRRDNTYIKKIDSRNGIIIKVKPKDYKIADWDNFPPDQDYFTQVIRVSKLCIIWGINNFDFKEKISSSGRIVWDKVVPPNDFSDCEIAWTNAHKKIALVIFRWSGMIQGDGFGRDSSQGNKSKNEKRIHPTQKPVALYKWLLKNYAKEGDLILDTHVGSGSSLIACEDTGHKYIGYEIDQDYYNSATKRINNYLVQLKMF